MYYCIWSFYISENGENTNEDIRKEDLMRQVLLANYNMRLSTKKVITNKTNDIGYISYHEENNE